MEKQQLFLNAIRHQRLGHAYLFAGAKGVGKADFVEWLAQTIFCNDPQLDGAACTRCDMCRRVHERNVIDFIEVYPDGQSIKVDQIRSLKQTLSRRGAEASQKVCVIYQADTMTTGASNSLLKLLEEPDMSIHFFLVTEHSQAILPTIQSRCQVIYFPERGKKEIVHALVTEGVSQSLATLLVELTNSLEQARSWAHDEEFLERKKKSWSLFQSIHTQPTQAFVHVQTEWMPILSDKETAQQFLEFVLLYYRDGMQCYVENDAAVIQQDQLATYHQINRQTTLKNMMQHVQWLNQALQKLQANVGIQAVIEQWILLCRTNNHSI